MSASERALAWGSVDSQGERKPRARDGEAREGLPQERVSACAARRGAAGKVEGAAVRRHKVVPHQYGPLACAGVQRAPHTNTVVEERPGSAPGVVEGRGAAVYDTVGDKQGTIGSLPGWALFLWAQNCSCTCRKRKHAGKPREVA